MSIFCHIFVSVNNDQQIKTIKMKKNFLLKVAFTLGLGVLMPLTASAGELEVKVTKDRASGYTVYEFIVDGQCRGYYVKDNKGNIIVKNTNL